MSENEILAEINRAQTTSLYDNFTLTRYAQFARHFPPSSSTVLDVGCNEGRGGAMLIEIMPHLHITGLDCVPERVAALDKSVYQAGFVSLTNKIELPSGRFDVIVGGEFLEHLPPLHILPTLSEFFRLLKLKGRLLLTTPNPGSIWNKRRQSSVLCDPAHLNQQFPQILRHTMMSVGFSSVRIFGSGKASIKIGERFPLFLYGSYLITGDKW